MGYICIRHTRKNAVNSLPRLLIMGEDLLASQDARLLVDSISSKIAEELKFTSYKSTQSLNRLIYFKLFKLHFTYCSPLNNPMEGTQKSPQYNRLVVGQKKNKLRRYLGQDIGHTIQAHTELNILPASSLFMLKRVL